MRLIGREQKKILSLMKIGKLMVIIQSKLSLSGEWVTVAKFFPHIGHISGTGKTEELSVASVKKRMQSMLDCPHIFIVRETSRQKKCENCGFTMKEY